MLFRREISLKRSQWILLVVMIFFSVRLFSQDKKVSGTVTDAGTSVGLPGVTVNVKGTKLTTQTDEKGNYFITPGKGKYLFFHL